MPAATAASPAQNSSQALPPDVEGWNAIRNSNSPDLFEAFLKEYPNSQYAGAARLKLAALRSAATPSSPQSTSTPSQATPPKTPLPPPTNEIVPVILHMAPAEYSEEGRRAHIQGSILVGAQVDEHGRVQNVRLVRGLGFGLDSKALESVKQWQFKPGVRNGLPARFYVPCHVDFRLADGGPWQIDGVSLRMTIEPHQGPGSMTPPELKQYVSPNSAACSERGGYVVLHLEIDEQGLPQIVTALQSPSERLGQAAVAAVQSWTFKPATLNRNPKRGDGRIVLACEGPWFSVADADRSDSSSRLGLGVSRPQMIFNLEPEYAEEARKQKLQGVVVLRIVIDQIGRPVEFSVVRALGSGLDEQAANAVAQWRFTPAMKDQKPVDRGNKL